MKVREAKAFGINVVDHGVDAAVIEGDNGNQLGLLIDPNEAIRQFESGSFQLASSGYSKAEGAQAKFVDREVCKELGLEEDEYIMVTLNVVRGRRKAKTA